jgi:hypothetical protein
VLKRNHEGIPFRLHFIFQFKISQRQKTGYESNQWRLN